MNLEDTNIKLLAEFLKYVIEDTSRITGDHDGNAGILSPSDSYEKLANDFVASRSQDKNNYDYLRGFCDGYGIQELIHKDDFPEGFSNINEVMDRMFELKEKSR